jgi:flagellar assembly protein FliH
MQKFLFDAENFDKDVAAAPSYTQEQLDAARAEGLALGRAEGAGEAARRQEEEIARALERIAEAAEQLISAEVRRETEKAAGAVRLTMRVAHKLLPRFARDYALGEIERVIGESLEVRRDEPRIAATVPVQHLDALRARIDALAAEKGFPGAVILLGDDHLSPSDCRVEWADGGAERLYERLFSQIEGEFTKAIAGASAPAAKE